MNRSIGLSNTALNFNECVVAAAVVMSRSFQAGAVLPIFHQALVRQWLPCCWMDECLAELIKQMEWIMIRINWKRHRINRSLTFDFWCSTQIWHTVLLQWMTMTTYINISVYQQCRSCTPTLHYATYTSWELRHNPGPYRPSGAASQRSMWSRLTPRFTWGWVRNMETWHITCAIGSL